VVASPSTVIPAKAGIHAALDSRLRGNDAKPSFAEPTSADPLAPLVDTLATAGDSVLSGWMAHIASLVGTADSPAALTDALLHSYGDLPTEQLTELMAMALAAAQLKGMDSVRAELPATTPTSFAEPVVVAPDPRIDQLSADIASLQSSVNVLAAKESLVVNNIIHPSEVPVAVHNTVQVPEQPAPAVHFAAPAITVQSAPVTVNNMHPARAIQTVERDANDEIVSTTTVYEGKA
jgi:hypothetical protein